MQGQVGNDIDISNMPDALDQVEQHLGELDRQINEHDARLEQRASPNPLNIPGVASLTDLGNAERMVDRWGERLRYSPAAGKWYLWDGRLWNPDADARLNQWAAMTVKGIYSEAANTERRDDKERIARHAIKSEARAKIRDMLDLARWMEPVPIDERAFDDDDYLINFINGTVELRGGDLREHRKEDLITKVCPVRYDADARSEVWEGFLDSVTDGDKELQLFLQRAVGYSLCGDYRDEVLFFIYGPTASGKSTFKDSIKAMMGSYAATADISTFLKFKGSSNGPRNDLARLARTRLVVSDEVDEGSKLATGLVKLWTGGDTLTARFLYREHFEFTSRGKLWLVANHVPKVSADDSAIWRRILRVPFLNEIAPEKQDHELKRVLCDPVVSGPAIATWAVRGCQMWLEDGLAAPEVVIQSTADYRSEMNPVSAYIEECCEILPLDQGAIETSSDLWASYQTWAEENGIRYPMKRTEFGKGLKTYGLESKQRAGDRARTWQGVRICRDNRNT